MNEERTWSSKATGEMESIADELAMNQVRDINSDWMCDMMHESEGEWEMLIEAYEKGHPDDIKKALEGLIEPIRQGIASCMQDKAEALYVRQEQAR